MANRPQPVQRHWNALLLASVLITATAFRATDNPKPKPPL